MSIRSESMSAEIAESMFSVMAFSPTQQPEYRDSSQPKIPRSNTSWTFAGASTGTEAPMNMCSDWWGSVEDLQAWSSPATASTPP